MCVVCCAKMLMLCACVHIYAPFTYTYLCEPTQKQFNFMKYGWEYKSVDDTQFRQRKNAENNTNQTNISSQKSLVESFILPTILLAVFFRCLINRNSSRTLCDKNVHSAMLCYVRRILLNRGDYCATNATAFEWSCSCLAFSCSVILIVIVSNFSTHVDIDFDRTNGDEYVLPFGSWCATRSICYT